MPQRHGSGASPIDASDAPWQRGRSVESRARARVRLVPAGEVPRPAASSGSRQPVRLQPNPAAQPQPASSKRRFGSKPRGTRNPVTVANKKAARFARRHVHTGLPAVDPDSVQKQALEGLEHPDLEELEQETEEVHTQEGLAEDLRVFDQESGKRLRSHSPPGADLRPVRTIPTPPTRKVAPREKRALPKPPPTPPPRRPLPAPAPVVLAPTPKSTPGQLSPELREELREKVKAYRVKKEKREVPEVKNFGSSLRGAPSQS